MSSVNWFFSLPLCKKQIKRFWPLWGLYGFFLLFLMPIYLLLQVDNMNSKVDLLIQYHNYGMEMAVDVAPWIGLFFGLFAAMAVWSYLNNNRAVSMIHSLPLTREGTFLTNYLTGIAFFLIPNLLIFLLTLIVEGLVGAVAVEAIATWFVCQTLYCFFFYSFATLLAFVTGHLLVVPVLFAIFNYLAEGIRQILDWIFAEFIYGYVHGSVALLDAFGKWFTPLYAFESEVDLTYQPVLEGSYHNTPAILEGFSVVAIYALVGLAMAVIAFFLYRYRKLELAGEVIVVRFLQPVFKYGFAFCSALVFGNMFYMMFESLFYNSVISLMIFFLIWGAIGYFAAEMLLRKSFRVIKQSAKGCLVLSLCIICFVVAMEWDLFRYETTIPDSNEVITVRQILKYGQTGVEFSDPDYISQAIALHHSAVENKAEFENIRRDPDEDEMMRSETKDGVYLENFSWYTVALEYTLGNGSTLQRSYRIPITREALQTEGSAAAQLDVLLNKPEWTYRRYFPDVIQSKDLVQITVDRGNQENYDRYDYMDPYTVTTEATISQEDITLVGNDAKMLYQAVLEDMQAGRIGTIPLLKDEAARNTNYENTIYFTFQGDYDTEKLYHGDWYENEDASKTNRVYYETNFPIQVTATATMAALEQLGVYDSIHFVTEYEYRAERAAEQYG